jgi:hypothetical protein
MMQKQHCEVVGLLQSWCLLLSLLLWICSCFQAGFVLSSLRVLVVLACISKRFKAVGHLQRLLLCSIHRHCRCPELRAPRVRIALSAVL